MPNNVWDEITYPFPNLNGCTVEVWEWIGIFIPHFIMDVITYPYWDLKLSYVCKGAPGHRRVEHRKWLTYIKGPALGGWNETKEKEHGSPTTDTRLLDCYY